MKLGICGVRGFGVAFLELFILHPGVESVSVTDLDAEVLARACARVPAVHPVENLDTLLDTDIDAVGIFTPPWTHSRLAVQALNAGKHVICACPAGLTLDELQAVIEAVQNTGKIYMTAETSYYYPGTMYARQAWLEGRFGDLVYGEGEYYYCPGAYDFYLRDYYCNMPPMLYATHSTSMVVSVTGKRIERVTCVGTPGLHPTMASLRRREEWRDNEVSNMTMLGMMSGGGVCRINEMRNVGCDGERGSILGTRASMRQHSGGTVWTNGLHGDAGEYIDLTTLWRDPTHHPQTAPASRLPASIRQQGMGHEGSHRFLADEFVRAVTLNRQPHNHLWMAIRYCVPGIIAWESLKHDGVWLDVPDFGLPTDGRKALDY